MSNFHSCTWFSLSGLEEAWQSMSGSLAGSSLGDVVFLLVHARVMRRLHDELASNDLVEKVHISPETCEIWHDSSEAPQEIEVVCAEFMDDSACPVFSHANHMVSRLRAVASCFHRIFSSFCLSVNWDRGKTEALVVFMGPGSQAARACLFEDQGACIQLDGIPGRTAPVLHVTRSYRHLGTHDSVSESLQDEISARMSALRTAFSQLRAPFLSSSVASPQQRSLVARSVLLSKGLFQAGTWPALYASELSRVHSTIMKVYQAMHEPELGERCSHQRLVSEGGVVAPGALLIHMRLRLFVRLCEKASPCILALLFEGMAHKRSWLASVWRDLQLLRDADEGAGLQPFESIIGYIKEARARPRAFRGYVSKVCNSATFSLSTAWVPSRSFAESLQLHSCSQCAAFFNSRQALATHCFRVHGERSVVRNRLVEPVCPACLCFFHTRLRLLVHVQQRSKRCLLFALRELPDLDPEVIQAADDQDRGVARALRRQGRRESFADEPASVAQGPLTLASVALGVTWQQRLRTQTGAAY